MNLPERRFEHGTVDSTNERALAALTAGTARHGDVHVARAQTSGRGRLGARWESPGGTGLYLSVILMPAPPPPPAALLSIATGLATLDALRALGLAGARLKWPNDVLVGPAKIAGCLVETRGWDPRAPHYVVGVGVNVAQRDFPEALLRERAVTSLALAGVEADVPGTEQALLRALARRWDDVLSRPADLAREFLAEAEILDRRVRVLAGEGLRVGFLAGIDPASGLLLESEDGSTLAIALEHVRAIEPV